MKLLRKDRKEPVATHNHAPVVETTTPAPVAAEDRTTLVETPAGEVFRCERCRHCRYVDSPVHGGHSTRRNCQRCGRTVGFVRWHEEDVVREQRRGGVPPAGEQDLPSMSEVERDWDSGTVPDAEPVPPVRIPCPPGLACPCTICDREGRGPNALYWRDRFGRIHCAGCRPCPGAAMFGAMLLLKGTPEEKWLEEIEVQKNPWQKLPPSEEDF